METTWTDDSLRLLQERLSRPLPPRPAPRPVSAAERGSLCAGLVPVALELSGVVRGEGDQAGVAALLATLRPVQKDALLVVAAAMIPQDKSAADLLAWVTWDETGRPLPPGAEQVARRQYVRRIPLAVPECGTIPGYTRHRKDREQPCRACLDVYNAGRRGTRASRRQQATTRRAA